MADLHHESLADHLMSCLIAIVSFLHGGNNHFMDAPDLIWQG